MILVQTYFGQVKIDNYLAIWEDRVLEGSSIYSIKNKLIKFRF